MSADNTIVVLQTKSRDGRPEFRVAHVQNAENLHDETDPDFRDDYIRGNFDKSVVFRTERKAFVEARRQHDNVEYVEYGITLVFLDMVYPSTEGAATSPGNSAVPHKASKKRSKKRRSPGHRIAVLTARVHDLQRQLQETEEALARSRAEKSDLVSDVGDLLDRHRG